MELWRQAVDATTATTSTAHKVATPRLAYIVLSVLDPTQDWNDKIVPMLDQIDELIRYERTQSQRKSSSLHQEWIRLYQQLYKEWLQQGATLAAHAIWSRLDGIEPNAAVEALKQVDKHNWILCRESKPNTCQSYQDS